MAKMRNDRGRTGDSREEVGHAQRGSQLGKLKAMKTFNLKSGDSRNYFEFMEEESGRSRGHSLPSSHSDVEQ